VFKITCDIQGFATVAEYSGLTECDTAIERAVPNISQALHSINIFELFYINSTCDTGEHKDECMIDTTIFPTIRHVPK